MVSFLPVSRPAQAARALFSALVDDAGLFPPEELDMASAVARHRCDRSAGSPVLSHRFVVPAGRLPELQSLLTSSDRFAASVITEATFASVSRVTALVAADGRLELAGVEATLLTDWRSDPAVVTDALGQFPNETAVFVEIPVRGDIKPALDLLQKRGWSAKIRCGGIRSELFPSTGQLADAITACAARGIAFKATAGLHHAIRYRDPVTGFTHHGFLNILLAVTRAVSGADTQLVTDALETTDPAVLVTETTAVDPATAARARELFVSYGSCSTSDPINDLTALNLLT
jgi:hypothetical protein